MPLKVISLIALIFFLLVLYGEVREIFVLSCLSDYTTSQTEGGAGQSPLDARGGETGRPLSLSSGLISRSEPARQSISQDPAVSFMISCFGIFLSYCHCLYRGQSWVTNLTRTIPVRELMSQWRVHIAPAPVTMWMPTGLHYNCFQYWLADWCLTCAMVRCLLLAVVLLAGVTRTQWSSWTDWTPCPACSSHPGGESSRSRYGDQSRLSGH